MQEASCDSESGSDNEGADETFDSMPDLQAKKIRETVLEESDSESESDKKSDTENQPSTSRRKRVRLASESEMLIDIDTSNEEIRDENTLCTRSSLEGAESS